MNTMRRDTQTLEEKIEALKSLLPLLEAHISCRMTQQYGTGEGAPPERPQGWVPPPPEPDCEPRCWECEDFKRGCTLLEIPHFHEYERLRRAYPQLCQFEGKEGLLAHLMLEHADWAAALYWVYVEPWDRFDPERRQERAEEGVQWLAERFQGYLPTYEPGRRTRRSREPRMLSSEERNAKIVELASPPYSWGWKRIANHLGCSETTISAVLSGRRVRSGRAK